VKSEDPNTNYKHVAAKKHRGRTRKELYLTVEFDGADMHDKALAKAELANRDFWDRMKITAAASFLGVLFGTVAGLFVGWLG
jgi:hypothetical protein